MQPAHARLDTRRGCAHSLVLCRSIRFQSQQALPLHAHALAVQVPGEEERVKFIKSKVLDELEGQGEWWAGMMAWASAGRLAG